MDKSYDIFYFLSVINKRKRMIVLIVLAASLVGMFTAIQAKRAYRASVTFLLTGEQSGTGATIASALGISKSPQMDIILSMLRSRRMVEDTIHNFGLEKNYKSMDNAVRGVRRMISIYPTQVEVVIEVAGSDPQIVADIANFCVSNLNVMATELVIGSSKKMVTVLDPAKPPYYAQSRQIVKKTAVAAVIGLMAGVFLAFVPEFLAVMRKRQEQK